MLKQKLNCNSSAAEYKPANSREVTVEFCLLVSHFLLR